MSRQARELLRGTHLSFSKLKTFEQCPLRFRLEYLDKVRSEPSGAVQLGSLVHAIIAKYLEERKGVVKTFRTEIGLLEQLAAPAAEELRATGDITGVCDLGNLRDLLEGFVETLPCVDGQAVLEVEATKMTRLGPYKLKSIIDLVLADAQGNVHIVDFKTGNPRYVADDQLRTYALPILGSTKKPVRTVKVSYVFLKHRSVRSFQVRRDECDEIVAQIVRAARKIEAEEEYRPRVTKLCGWCGVRRHCPAYDGD